jgi:hypothetical protein
MHYANSSLIVGFHSLILHYTFSYASIHDKVDKDWETYPKHTSSIEAFF